MKNGFRVTRVTLLGTVMAFSCNPCYYEPDEELEFKEVAHFSREIRFEMEKDAKERKQKQTEEEQKKCGCARNSMPQDDPDCPEASENNLPADT